MFLSVRFSMFVRYFNSEKWCIVTEFYLRNIIKIQ